MSNKKQQYKSLLSVLTITNPDACKDILERYSDCDASKIQSIKELQQRLARAYAVSSYKVDIDKEFASIHPHKDFILKYLAPKQEEFQVKNEPVVIQTDSTAKEENKPDCPCKKKQQAGGYSNIEGDSLPFNKNNEIVSPGAIFALSLVGVVAIVGMVLYLKK